MSNHFSQYFYESHESLDKTKMVAIVYYRITHSLCTVWVALSLIHLQTLKRIDDMISDIIYSRAEW